MKIPKVILSQEEEIKILKRIKPYLKEKYGCEVKIERAEDSKNPKAKDALPGRPAIFIE